MRRRNEDKKSNPNTRVRPRASKRDTSPPVEELPARENIADIRIARRKKQHKQWRRLAIRLGIVVLALVVLAVAVIRWEALQPANLWGSITGLFSGSGNGDGFPVTISGDTVVAMTETDKQLTVLTNTSLLWLNQKGGETDRRAHTFARPALRAAGNYVLTADLGGKRLRLDTARKLEREWEAAGEIAAMDVTAQGVVALVTASSRSFLSEAVVLDKKGTSRFHWYSAEWLLTGVTLREDGKQVAVIGVAASGGALKTRLMIFDLTSENPVATFEGTDLLALEVSYYAAGGGIVMVGDRACWSISADLKTRTVTDYADVELLKYAIGRESTALAVRHVGGGDGGELRVLNSAGVVTGAGVVTERIQDITPAASDNFWMLTSGQLLRLNKDGISHKQDTALDSIQVTAYQKKVAVLGLTEIRLTTG